MVLESRTSLVRVLGQSRPSNSLLVFRVERSEHWNADAEDGEVGFEDEEEDCRGHGSRYVAVEVDGRDVDESEDGAHDAAVEWVSDDDGEG